MARRVLQIIAVGVALQALTACSSKPDSSETVGANAAATLSAPPGAESSLVAAADTLIGAAASSTSSSPQYQIAQADLDALGAEINLSPEEKEALALVSAVAP